ncbi:MAG: pantetheine-phosphate adenylyltransferase [Candidatus Brocadiia bacterium]
MSDTQRTCYDSPAGRIALTVRQGKLVSVDLLRKGEQAPAAGDTSSEVLKRCTALLERYFAGRNPNTPRELLDLSGATDFQRRVYEELLEVPFGEVVTYGELAGRVGSPGGARAVGQAVGRNPLPVLVPCHRVVAADAKVGGFGAGPRWKKALLSHEGWTVEEGILMRSKHGEPKTCVYAGSFDPPTEGHMFMVERGAELFDTLIVAVGINPNKRYTFSLQERLELLRECTAEMTNVTVDSFEGQLLVHYAESVDAGYILRGIRSEEDYRFEHPMRNVNEDLAPEITTVFLIPPREICEISSSFVKGLVGFEGWEEVVKPYVPEPVYKKLLSSEFRWHETNAGPEGGTD